MVRLQESVRVWELLLIEQGYWNKGKASKRKAEQLLDDREVYISSSRKPAEGHTSLLPGEALMAEQSWHTSLVQMTA